MSPFIKDLTGQKFGYLIVKQLDTVRTKEGRSRWLCKCECGNEKVITGKYLLNGDITGCGCYLTRHLRAKPGEKNPNWKGGKNNRGSLAWANGKISDINKISEKLGYSGTSDTSTTLIDMLEKSEGKCAICGKVENDSQYGRNHIDHCHTTGSLRGMLCSSCNVGIGSFRDSFELLTKAAEYVKNHTPAVPPALA